MTEAFKRGYLDKMAELRKRAQAVPGQKEWLKEQQNIQVRNRRPTVAPVVA